MHKHHFPILCLHKSIEGTHLGVQCHLASEFKFFQILQIREARQVTQAFLQTFIAHVINEA